MAERPAKAGQSLGFVAPLGELVWTLAALERRLALGLSVALSEESTTMDQWRILETLDRLDSPTMGELAEATGMANASLSRTVDSLEDAASAFRLPTIADRRRITVHLSDLGQQRLERTREIVAAWERTIEHRLGADAVAALLGAADTATCALDGTATEP